MNKIRKIVIGAVIAAGIGCLAGAVGCDSEPDYYKLTFEGKGLDYVYQGALAPEDGDTFVSGDEVKAGVEVRFTLALGADTVGTPQILLNGVGIEPDDDGVYSFIIDRESTVTVSGLQLKEKTTFSADDYYKFYDEDGDLITGEVSIVKGEEFKFKLWVSPYIKNTYTVTNDTEELTPGGDGFYTITGGKSTVNVNNVEQEDSYIERGEGDGSEENPFLIRKPIDLFMTAALINSDYYSEYSFKHYKLVEDIDMDGEKLFVIGDYSNTSAVFCGTFDGDGHTISNFYITDEVVDQSTFVQEYLPYVGLFGYATATADAPAVIKNLTLEDYEVAVHPADSSSATGAYAGSVLGYGIGVQIDNVDCVNGKVVSYNDNKNMSYLGGVAGVLQSAYSNTVSALITFDAYVNGCKADVEVTGTGAIRAAGGAVGVLSTADAKAIAYVSNCVTTGDVNGAMYCGGVVGTLGRYSSVSDCYTTANVAAANSINTAGVDATYKRACAGGIVGYAENDSVISGCYAANTSLKFTSASGLGSTGKFAGYTDDAATDAADSEKSVQINCLASGDGSLSELGWNADEWDMSGSLPVYKGAAARTVNITVKKGDGTTVGTYAKSLSSAVPVYVWYDGVMPEYISSAEGRSWGYYFDKELTQRVPYGYIPVADCDMYVGFADYSEVAGNYYIGSNAYGNEPYFTLDSEGGVFFRDGGMNFGSTYAYDGNRIILYNTCLGSLVYAADEVTGFYATVIVEKSGDGYKLTGSVYVASSDSDGNVTYSLEPIDLTAQKQAKNLVYGEYVNSDGGVLLLKENGTGTLTQGNEAQSFTFTVSESGVVEISTNIPVTIGSDGKVTAFLNKAAFLKDSFAGVWKTSANSQNAYEFDGFGTVKYGDVSGTYEVVADGQAILCLDGNEIEAKFASDGVLYINGTAYYASDGFTGVWYGTVGGSESIELSLGGIGAKGYGTAEIIYYGGVATTFAAQYSVTSAGVMRVYVDDILYGEIKINSADGSASGAFLSYKDYRTLGYLNYAAATFRLYDLFRGVWISDVEGVSTVNFTGKGAEDGGATALVTATNGKVTYEIYELDSATSGKLTINGTEYTLTLDEATGKISVQDMGGLARRDGWYGVVLYDVETSYTFDGNGYLTGKATVSGGDALEYTVGADGAVTLGGYALTPDGSSFAWNGTKLSFNTGFAKTWVMPVTNKKIIISEIRADLTAEVTIDGVTTEYIYSPAENRLTYTETDAKGATTVTKLSLLGGAELSVTVSGTQSGDYVCVSEDNLDDWGGVYSAEDGTSWSFDGLGLSYYGGGSATYTDKDGNTVTYSYKQDKLGAVYIRTGAGTGAVFAEVSEGGYKAEGAETAYSPVAADSMYLTEVRYGEIYLVFDGTGSFRKNTGTGYEKYGDYIVLTTGLAIVDMTDGGGKSLGVISTVGGTKVLTLYGYVEWTLSGTDEKYFFDEKYFSDGSDDSVISGILWNVDGDTYTRKYSYTRLSTENQYGLEDSDGKTYIMKLNPAEKTFVLEEYKDDED